MSGYRHVYFVTRREVWVNTIDVDICYASNRKYVAVAKYKELVADDTNEHYLYGIRRMRLDQYHSEGAAHLYVNVTEEELLNENR